MVPQALSECVKEHSLSSMRSCFLLPTASGGSTAGQAAGCRLVWSSESLSLFRHREKGVRRGGKIRLKVSKAAHRIIGSADAIKEGTMRFNGPQRTKPPHRCEMIRTLQVSLFQGLAFRVKVPKALLLYCGARMQSLGNRLQNSED